MMDLGSGVAIAGLCVSGGAVAITAITVTIGEGETTPGSVDAALIGPVPLAVNQSIPWEFNPPMKLTANKSLVADASGAGNVNVFVEGEIV
jgi:hypothetical protein